jgi:hypothetical protein
VFYFINSFPHTATKRTTEQQLARKKGMKGEMQMLDAMLCFLLAAELDAAWQWG